MRPLVAVLLTVATGVLAGIGLRVLGGLLTPWAVLLAVPIAAVTMVGLLAPRGAEPIWAPLPEPAGRATEHQAASLASRLAEAAEYPTRFQTRVQPRLRRLALAKLRRAGIEELDDPRAAAVLGARMHRLVTDPTATMPDPETAAELFSGLHAEPEDT